MSFSAIMNGLTSLLGAPPASQGQSNPQTEHKVEASTTRNPDEARASLQTLSANPELMEAITTAAKQGAREGYFDAQKSIFQKLQSKLGDLMNILNPDTITKLGPNGIMNEFMKIFGDIFNFDSKSPAQTQSPETGLDLSAMLQALGAQAKEEPAAKPDDKELAGLMNLLMSTASQEAKPATATPAATNPLLAMLSGLGDNKTPASTKPTTVTA